MDHDLWQQWQAFASLWAPATAESQAGFARAAGSGFGPFTEAAERFTAAARSFLDGAANASAPAAGQAAQGFSDFLREQFAAFQMPWSSGVGAGAGRGAPPSTTGDSPAIGASREHQQRWQRMAQAAQRVDDAQRRLQRLWSDVLREAALDFAAKLAPPHPGGLSADALRKLYDTWIDCAEEAYARTSHGEGFCDALAEYVNASSQWRRELQASSEHLAKVLDLPTRSEINTLSRRLKAVEQLLHAAQNKPPPKPASRTRPKRRKATQ
jgi:class III poly(R)-hydroxyalkanoic acid synthase PhaE subunit